MKYFFFLMLCLVTGMVQAQSTYHIDSIRSVKISESYWVSNMLSYPTVVEYEIVPKGEVFSLYRTSVSGFKGFKELFGEKNSPGERFPLYIKKINQESIQAFMPLNNNPDYEAVPTYALSNAYLKKNAKRIAKSHSSFKKMSKPDRRELISLLKDADKVNSVLAHCFTETMDFSKKIEVIFSSDTLTYTSNGQNPFLLPWETNMSGVRHNKNLSAAYYEIVPLHKLIHFWEDNKSVVEKNLSEQLYQKYIFNKAESAEGH
ncbi:hypothetical protein RCC89_01565 [Cytophagaceae bacterium ABcell3]|nr:hypothetical protein RCC89_01565 [Cytophagaceae bacterium ABcell3]